MKDRRNEEKENDILEWSVNRKSKLIQLPGVHTQQRNNENDILLKTSRKKQ